MKRFAIVAAVALLALGMATAASAANAPHPTLDAAASAIAGHPVSVYCETDDYNWDIYNEMWGVYGFTVQGTNTIWIAPDQCDALQTTLANGPWGYLDAGMSYFALALLTLIHEAKHQAGFWGDEAGAECAALPLVADVAIDYFHVPEVLAERVLAYKWKKVGKKRIRVAYVKVVQYTNPDIQRIQQWAKIWHDAAPPEYRGNC